MATVPQLTTQQLEYLVAVSQHDTWADAAASLGVSGSALSQGIAELERRLGMRLFERDGRRRSPAPGHDVVLAYAERTVAATHDLARWLDARATGRGGAVRLGMIDAAATHHFRDVLRRHRRERPDTELLLTVAPSADLLSRLARAELDLVVCVQPDEVPVGIRTETLLDDPLDVLAPGDRRAGSGADPVSWGPFVTFPTGSHTRRLVADAVRAAGAAFDVVAESHQPEVLVEMVLLGVGWTVLPLAGADVPDGVDVVRRRLVERTLVLATRADAAPHPATQALHDALTTSIDLA